MVTKIPELLIRDRLKKTIPSGAAASVTNVIRGSLHTLIIIKKDNNRETYDRSKIEAGVLRACHKRPVSANQITRLIEEVETQIFNMEEKEISSSKIGELVMSKLKNIDAVAYVRFASVYREFKDVNTFMDELKKMLDK